MVEVLELCDADQLIIKEQEYINKLSALNRDIGYNLSPTAGTTTGYKFNEIKRLKMSETLRKRYEDPEERLKVRLATKSATSDPDYRKGCSERTKAKWLDPEFRQKQKDGMIGSISDTTRRNQAQKMREKFKDLSNREALALNIPHRKRVRCRETGTIYNSVSEAVRETGVSIQSVKNDLRGKTDFRTVRRKFTFEVCNE